MCGYERWELMSNLRGSVIIINGLPGTGSTTVAKILARELNMEHLYAGGIFRAMAAEAGQVFEQYMTEIAQDPAREKAVDAKLVERARQGGVILESRVMAWILPPDIEAYRIWLTCNLTERARRINQREVTEDALARIEYREQIDVQRYSDLYDLDLSDLGVFDQVIDTTITPAAEVAAQVLERLKD